METRTRAIDEVSGFSGGAVVVDVMRAFTVAAHALGSGASEIVLVRELANALRMKRELPGSLAFQDGEPVSGFDLANSPAMLRRLEVAGRTIFQRTTHGTRGAIAACHCEPLYCASFACASATARELRLLRDRPVAFVITGDDGRAEEDLACAAFITALAEDLDTSPFPFAERARRARAAEGLRSAVRKGHTGVHEQDVELCLEADVVDFALRAETRSRRLTLRTSRSDPGAR